VSRLRLALLGLLLAPLLGVQRPGGLGDVVDVRHWSYEDYTRVVVELTRPVETTLHRLPPDPRTRRPERLYLDLPGIWVGLRYKEPIPVGDGLLRDVRVGQNTRTRSRVVIDLARYERHRIFRLSSPHRIVVDVFGRPDTRGRGEAPGGPAGPQTRPPRPGPGALPVELRSVHTVVVDAGHGGRDPGAVGVGGVREKDVTLGIARELARRLEDRGFRVVMTRTGDQTLGLEERTAFAEGVGGDVFVSIHANAAPRRAAQGIETYYLDRGHERHTLRVAARENGVPPGELDELQRTVAGLRVTEMSRHSAHLAHAVHERLLRGVLADVGGTRDLGVKQGPFHVLFLANMPSILVETGFVTNRTEARRLRSGYYQSVVAEHVARGLSRYRSEHGSVAVAGSRQ
jgi:N-acetylmuramoyl-L-alanine amidase